MRRILPLVAALGVLGLAGTAHAGYTVSLKHSGSGDNVIENSCSLSGSPPAGDVEGCLNQSHSQGVLFSSSSPIQYASGGQAEIVAKTGGSFSTLTISLAGGETFEWISLGVAAGNDDRFSISYTDANGTSHDGNPALPSNYYTLKNGDDGFTLSGVDFASVTVTDLSGPFDYVKQVRFDGLKSPPVDTPEPASIALLGIGVLGLGLAARRRRHARPI